MSAYDPKRTFSHLVIQALGPAQVAGLKSRCRVLEGFLRFISAMEGIPNRPLTSAPPATRVRYLILQPTFPRKPSNRFRPYSNPTTAGLTTRF